MPTFVVEDGTGLGTANAYVSEAEADAYHDNYGQPASWTSAVQADKEHAIREATQYLDWSYVARWRGSRANQDQSLDWPRRYVYDTDGWSRDSDVVPPEVKDATCILALRVIDGETLMPDLAVGTGGVKMRRIKIGELEKEEEFHGSRTNFKKYSSVTAVLRPLLTRSGQRERA